MEQEKKPRPITGYVLICDRILSEGDGILSAIRMVDHYQIQAPAELEDKDVFVDIQIVATAKFALNDDQPRTMRLQIVRPNGEVVDLAGSLSVPIPPRVQDFHRGANVLSMLKINLRVRGIHFAVLLIDDEEYCRTPFMLGRIDVEIPARMPSRDA